MWRLTAVPCPQRLCATRVRTGLLFLPNKTARKLTANKAKHPAPYRLCSYTKQLRGTEMQFLSKTEAGTLPLAA